MCSSSSAEPTAHAGLRLSEEDVGWLVRLLEVPSVSPLEGGDPAYVEVAQRIVVEGALARGFGVRLWDAPLPEEIRGPYVPAALRTLVERPGFLASQPSVVLGLGAGQRADRRLVLNFHIDTVGPHLPPRYDGGTLRGRGAVDNKGPGVAAAVGVSAAFDAEPRLHDEIEVLLASVPGEEGGAMGVYGTRWLVDRGHTGRLMLFAEPTGCEVYDACSATMTARLSVDGDDSTDDRPEFGHNATIALALLTDLLARELLPTAERLGARVCIGGVRTGASHNRVYGTGELLVNIAYYEASQARALERCVVDVVERSGEEARRRYGDTMAVRRLLSDWPVHLDWLKRDLPPLDNRDADMERVLASAGLPRRAAVAEGLAFTCDAIWAAGADRYVAACGPGTLAGSGAHTGDEHVRVDDLDGYASAIRDLVLSFAAHIRHLEGVSP